MILYFSGTGNSAYIAAQLAARLGDDLISINDKIRDRDWKKITSSRPFIFVVPTYAWRIPRLVEEWICKMTFTGASQAYFVMTCGDSNGNAVKYIKKLCAKKKFRYMGCQKIVMPENYIAMFPVPEKPEAIATVMRAEPLIEQVAEAVLAGRPLEKACISVVDKITSGIVNSAFYAFFVKDKKFYATEECVSCGKCASVCPLHNITITDGKPVWNGKCTHCMACICDCPKEAIEYGKASQGKWRYHCPEIDEK